MKVALVIHRFSTNSGAGRAACTLAHRLTNDGHEVHVYARRADPMNAVNIHNVPCRGWSRNASFARRVRDRLARTEYDIVHSFTRTPRQDVLRLGGGTHVEYLAHTDSQYGWIDRLWRRINPKERTELRLERESFAPGAYRRIVAVSRTVRDEAIRHYSVPADDVEVIYNAVDSTHFRPNPEARTRIRSLLGISQDTYMLLFCGTGFRRKGLHFAIDAVSRVKNALLVVAGEGTQEPHARVFYMGHTMGIRDYYAAADVMILPTLYDPFPNACMEAMASGIPVIISRIAGVSEIIDGDSIVVEDPRDVDALTEAVRRLEDPAVRIPMGEAARRKAQQFTPERNLQENLRIYAAILREKGRVVDTRGGES